MTLWNCDKRMGNSAFLQVPSGFGLFYGPLRDHTILFRHQDRSPQFSGALRTRLWFLYWMLASLFQPTEVGKIYQSFFLFFFFCTLFQRKWVLETFTTVNHGLNSILVHLFNCCSVFSASYPVLWFWEHRGNCIVT